MTPSIPPSAPIQSIKQLSGGVASALLSRGSLRSFPLWPAAYANAPTLANAGPGGASPINSGSPKNIAWTGQPILTTAGAASSSGANTLTVASATNIAVNMPVSHMTVSSGSTSGAALNAAVPAGTVVTNVSGTTITLSNTLTGNVASGDRLAFGTPVINFLGATYLPVSQGSLAYYGNGCNGAWTRQSFAIEFDYYGVDCAIAYRAISAAPAFWVWEDGQPCTSAPVQLSGLSAGSYYRYRITFNNASDSAARWRRVRVYMDLADFGWLDISPAEAVSLARVTYPKIACYGDSWTEGALGPVPFTQTITGAFGQMFGTVPYKCGQGGTGYVANGGGGSKAAYTDSARLASLIATGADLVFVMGSVNDVSQTQNAVQTAAQATLSAIRAGLPNARIVVASVQPNVASLGTPANYLGPNAGVLAAAAAMNIPAINFMQSGWVYGTGHSGGATGDGNADIIIGSDSVHPVPGVGTEFFGRMLAEATAPLI